MEAGFIMLLVLVVSFVILGPALIRAGTSQSPYRLVRDRRREKAAAQNRQIVNTASKISLLNFRASRLFNSQTFISGIFSGVNSWSILQKKQMN